VVQHRAAQVAEARSKGLNTDDETI
jgi:hypothetical protein